MCPYKDLFGKPGEGFHSARIFGLALGDTLGTILLSLVVSYVFKLDIWISLITMFVLGEVSHYLFGTQTAFLTLIGIRAC
jgi:hypothetical protein